MSETIAGQGADRPSHQAPSTAPGRDGAWSALVSAAATPVGAAIAALTVLALGVRLYLLSRPGCLLGVTEYDDGPYFGSAVDLLRGVLPYRDFIFVQPPGITLLMTPAALLAKVTGTAWGLAAGRLLTATASAAGVLVVGMLVRHRGLLAVIVACGVLAVYPDSVQTARTVLVEPWEVLFCLLGALAVFDRDHVTQRVRRLVWGGVLFGFAGAIEVWAIVPVAVVFLLILRSLRIRRAAQFTAGVAAGFLVPTVPFAAIAPRRFYESLITAQVAPRPGSTRVSLWYRLKEIDGIIYLHPHGHGDVLLISLGIVGLALGMLVLASLLTSRLPPPLEWFGVGTAALVVVMFLVPDQFHYHFPAFLAPFLAMAVALPAARLLEAMQPGAARGASPDPWLGGLAAGLAAIVIALFSVNLVTATSTMSFRHVSPAIDRIVPPGSCVATDAVSFLLMTNRFISDVPGCTKMVDGLGTDLAFSGGLKPSTGAGAAPAVAAVWRSAFGHAQFVLLSRLSARRVAWTPALRAYFNENFVLVLREGKSAALYRRKTA